MRIFRIISGIVLSVLAAVSCSPLSKAQLEAVRQLTFNSDTVSRSPAVLFGEMADIRLHRGLYYALSLSSGETRYAEVTALAEASMDDEGMVRKADGYVDVLNSYLRALRSLSSEQRWKGAGTQFRGIGSRVDSVIYRYNILADKEEGLPEGYARMAGRVLGYASEEIMKAVQSKAVRNVVIAGDTLVTASCDSLMSILRSDEMNALIEHERESLGDNFSAWLSAMEMNGASVSVSDLEAYVELARRADNLSSVRNRCVSALRSLKNAHASLAADLAVGETDLSADLYEELVRLNRLAAQVAGMLN